MAAGGWQPDLYVVVRLLEALWRNGNRSRPTHLQAASGVNYTRFERYLGYLESRGLVARDFGSEGETWIVLTVRGHEALRFLATGLRDILGVRATRRDGRAP